MARYPFNLPDIGEGVAEAELVEWHAAVGDRVEEGQPLAAVMTQKATVELEAPVAGTILERRGEVGDSVAVGSLLMLIESEGEEAEPGEPASKHVAQPVQPASMPLAKSRVPTTGKVLASPAVRQRARDLEIDLASVPSAGERVTHADLDRHLAGGAPRAERREFPHVAGGTEVPVVGMRRQIARHMAEAHRHIPHFTYVEELDVTALEDLRGGKGTGFLPYLIVALSRALERFPDLNARYDDQREMLHRYAAVHLGIAVQTDAGLMVPVLRNAERMNLAEVAQSVAQLAERARAGTLAPDELAGSTITVTSLGKLGGVAATPVINWPEVAILCPGRIVERPAWIDGQVQPRKVLNLSISCDHRVIDGAVAAAFVQAIAGLLAEPGQLAG